MFVGSEFSFPSTLLWMNLNEVFTDLTENAANVFHPHYPGEIWKSINNHRSQFEFVFEKNSGREIVKLRFRNAFRPDTNAKPVVFEFFRF